MFVAQFCLVMGVRLSPILTPTLPVIRSRPFGRNYRVSWDLTVGKYSELITEITKRSKITTAYF